MSKIIVTGGNGFIGSHLVEMLVSDGHDVHVIDDLSAELNDFVFLDGARYYKIDIGNSNGLKEIDDVFDGTDFIFHLAAESRIQPAILDPEKAHRTNCMGTLNLLQLCVKHGIKKLIYSSTSSVYESLEENGINTDENTPINCLNPYSLSKLFGEELCRYYSTVHGVDTVVFRYFNVFGERSPSKGTYAPVIGIFLDQYHSNRPLTVVGDGEQRRDFIHVRDVAHANILAMRCSDTTKGLPINIGSGYNISINEIAAIFLDHDPNVIIHHEAQRPGEVRNTNANIGRARSVLGFHPTIKVENWVALQIKNKHA